MSSGGAQDKLGKGDGMKTTALLLSLGAATAGGILWLAWPRNDSTRPVQPLTVDTAQGQALYQANCAACHGDGLQGAADWRRPGPDGVFPPPPHDQTGHTWHHGDALLFNYTKLGGQAMMARSGGGGKSGMPGFGATLSDAQIWDILAYIKSTWPPRVRAVQAERTKAERAGGR